MGSLLLLAIPLPLPARARASSSPQILQLGLVWSGLCPRRHPNLHRPWRRARARVCSSSSSSSSTPQVRRELGYRIQDTVACLICLSNSINRWIVYCARWRSPPPTLSADKASVDAAATGNPPLPCRPPRRRRRERFYQGEFVSRLAPHSTSIIS